MGTLRHSNNKIQTTYQNVTKITTRQDDVEGSSHAEFQLIISILSTIGVVKSV